MKNCDYFTKIRAFFGVFFDSATMWQPSDNQVTTKWVLLVIGIGIVLGIGLIKKEIKKEKNDN